MTSRILKIIIVILVLVLINVALFLFFQRSPNGPETTDIPQIPTSSGADGTYQGGIQLPPEPPEEREVFSYTGTITSINDTDESIEINTNHGIKTITINNSTTIVERLRPTREQRLKLSTDELATTFNKETNYQQALKVNDVVTALSDVNIQGAAEYTADKIIVIN